MRARGLILATALVLSSAFVAPVSASTPSTTTHSASTLTLSIPGPITGCYFYGAGANDSLRALLDLVRPSAFTTNPTGDVVGAPGPIVSAELVSLAPQTVIYTINTSWRWSNGVAFSGEDLRQWYLRARVLPVTATDGYRAIGSLQVSAAGDKVRVVFAQPYADWASLFRDVNERNGPLTCTLSTLASSPSLGPYVLRAISAHGATLVRSESWKGTRVRFDVISVRTDLAPSLFRPTNFVDYRTSLSPQQLNELTNTSLLDGHIGSSNAIVTVGFSPHRALTVQLAVRQFLSWAIDRQRVINQELGPFTFSQGLGASTIFSQGQRHYPGIPGLGPLGQAQQAPLTTIPTSAAQDCVSCAPGVLTAAGFIKKNALWRSPSGAPVVVSVAVGPSVVDRSSALIVESQWRAAGVATRTLSAPTDQAVAAMLAHGTADVGIFTLRTGTFPSQSARWWTQRNFGDGYDIGWRSSLIDQWYSSALDTFNPNDAATTYGEIDHQITTQAWERPLFTLPSVVTWSTNVAGIYGSVTLQSFVDELPTWGTAPSGTNSSGP